VSADFDSGLTDQEASTIMAHTHTEDVEALARMVLIGVTKRPERGNHVTAWQTRDAASVILDSDWLRDHDARVRRAAGEQIARAIEALNDGMDPTTGTAYTEAVYHAARIALEVTR
jgi:hypothetical protein